MVNDNLDGVGFTVTIGALITWIGSMVVYCYADLERLELRHADR
jgi:hypothetical protein